MSLRIYRLFAVSLVVLAGLGLPVTSVTAEGSWYAEYFSNSDLAGGPTLTRFDETLHFEWGDGSPGTGIPSDNFSARWTKDVWFESGTYRFSYRSDDGIRIWVGGTLVVDDWRDREASWSFVDHVVTGGTQAIRVEYYEHEGNAAIQVGWEQVSGGSAWRGEYFSNRDLSGGAVLVRYDSAVDFDWHTGSPDGAVPADNFSVRWSRNLGFTAGTYRFYASCDDGVRVFVDGSQVVDAWQDQELPNTSWGDITLGGGQHNVVVEYYEHGGEASAHVWWDMQQGFSGWEGRYYDNDDMRGGPALIRDDAAIDFDWGEGAPASWMPSDNFSAVWERRIDFSPGYYRFNVHSDDGVRVWLDGAVIMDYWQPQEFSWHYVDGTYLSGAHTIKVEYFERNGSARVRFWWESSSVSPSPGTAPGTTPSVTAPGPWQAEYFDNWLLTGEPALVRSDAALNFNWGLDSPGPGLSSDYFSVRWSGTFSFGAGRYTFTTYTDDGVRLIVDGRRVIDSWWAMRDYRRATLDLAAGAHTIEMQYFERTGAARARLQWSRIGTAIGTQLQPTPAPVRDRLAPRSTACVAGEPLRLDIWPVATACNPGGGWKAMIYIQGHGGDCHFSYAWEGETRNGSTGQAMIIEVDSASYGTAIVGTASVTSGGQTINSGLHVPPPVCR
jgi:hypothetical protein